MAATQRNSQGATIAFSTLTLDILVSGMTVDQPGLPELDGSHLASTEWREMIPAMLKSPGTVSVDVWFDPDESQAVNDGVGTEVTITIQFPPIDAQATGAKLEGLGWINSPLGFTLSTDELMTGTLEVKFAAGYTYTPGA